MQVTAVETFVVDRGMRQWPYRAVRTDEGVSGYGEFGDGQFVRGLPGLVDDLSARVIGKDPRRPARYPRVPLAPRALCSRPPGAREVSSRLMSAASGQARRPE